MRYFYCLALLSAVSTCATAQQYVISTFAGGAPLPTPVAALNSPLPSPGALSMDSAGNLYIVTDDCVFEISPNGVMTRLAGNARPGFSGDGGPAINAQFDAPQGIAVDSAGNVYVADSANNRIRRVSNRAASSPPSPETEPRDNPRTVSLPPTQS